jgi:hypothetical protein
MLFLPSLMFAGKARANQSEPPAPAREKLSSLVQIFVNCGCKKFYNNAPSGQCYKTFYGRNLRILEII